MPKRYRIEIDVHVDDEADTAIMGLARTHYRSGSQAWTERNGTRVPVPVNEFIEDMESALLELIEAGFQAAIPNAVNGISSATAKADCPPPLLNLRGRLSEFIPSYMAYSDFFQTDLTGRRTIMQAE